MNEEEIKLLAKKEIENNGLPFIEKEPKFITLNGALNDFGIYFMNTK
jgi:hypothetical protein